MSVKSILWTTSCSVFRRTKLYIPSCAMEERKIRFSSNGWRFILTWQWNSLTLVIS